MNCTHKKYRQGEHGVVCLACHAKFGTLEALTVASGRAKLAAKHGGTWRGVNLKNWRKDG